jgi:hypothetical protein
MFAYYPYPLIKKWYQVKEPISLDLVFANASEQVKPHLNQISQDPIINDIKRDYTPSSEKKTDLR